MSLCGILLRRTRFPCFRSGSLSREGQGDVGFPFKVDREVSSGCSCHHHGTAVQHGVGVVGGCVDIMNNCLDAGL